MTTYFNSVDAVRNYAQVYPENLFRVVNNPQKCKCNSYGCGFQVSDRHDSEILENLVVCPVCARLTETESKQSNN